MFSTGVIFSEVFSICSGLNAGIWSPRRADSIYGQQLAVFSQSIKYCTLLEASMFAQLYNYLLDKILKMKLLDRKL
jgi:hypothetical protein